jgi:transposase-like protein
LARKRRRHSNQFKVALEATKGFKTLNEIAGEYYLHPNQVSNWKKQLLEGRPVILSSNASLQLREQEARQTELYEQIGRLKNLS